MWLEYKVLSKLVDKPFVVNKGDLQKVQIRFRNPILSSFPVLQVSSVLSSTLLAREKFVFYPSGLLEMPECCFQNSLF